MDRTKRYLLANFEKLFVLITLVSTLLVNYLLPEKLAFLIAAILAEVGAGFEHIVETTEYFTTTDNYRKTAAVRREFFRPPCPAATGVQVKGLLREGALIEIKALAVVN